MSGVTLKQVTYRVEFTENPRSNTIYGVSGAKDKCGLTEKMTTGDAFNLLGDWVHQQTYLVKAEGRLDGQMNLFYKHVYFLNEVIEVPDTD